MGKRYGQHFLRSPAVLEAIAAGAEIGPGEPVLEIGPGEGALTERLLTAGADVAAVEIDPVLCVKLRERFAAVSRFRLIEADVLQLDLSPQHLFGSAGLYAVIANLPYYLTTPLLFRLIAERRRLSRLVLMVQREIATRLVASPRDGKDYGALSVAAQHTFRMKRLLDVPPGAFRPPPKVDSAVVRFVPREPQLPPAREARFLAYVKAMFIHRRKLMLGNLKRGYGPLDGERLAALEGLIAGRRADALTPEEHLAVFELLHEGAGT